jgi:hypothetical protein
MQMMSGVPKTNRMLLLHEWLFSLNIGFAIAYALFAYEGNGDRAVHASKPVRNFLDAFGALLFRIAPLGTDQPRSILHRHFQIWEVGFIIVMLGIGVLLFLLLRRRAQTSAGRIIFSSLSGIAALVAVPAFWLYIVHATWSVYDPGTFWRTYGYVSVLEIAATGGILYLVRRGAVRWGILAFALHYIFWVFVMGQRSGVPVVLSIPLSLVFPCSGFAWLLYVRTPQLQPIT